VWLITRQLVFLVLLGKIILEKLVFRLCRYSPFLLFTEWSLTLVFGYCSWAISLLPGHFSSLLIHNVLLSITCNSGTIHILFKIGYLNIFVNYWKWNLASWWWNYIYPLCIMLYVSLFFLVIIESIWFNNSTYLNFLHGNDCMCFFCLCRQFHHFPLHFLTYFLEKRISVV